MAHPQAVGRVWTFGFSSSASTQMLEQVTCIQVVMRKPHLEQLAPGLFLMTKL